MSIDVVEYTVREPIWSTKSDVRDSLVGYTVLMGQYIRVLGSSVIIGIKSRHDRPS